MIFTDDPVRDAERWLAEQVDIEELLPKCCCCGNPIDDDYYYDIDGDFFCFDCLNTTYRKDIEDYEC